MRNSVTLGVVVTFAALAGGCAARAPGTAGPQPAQVAAAADSLIHGSALRHAMLGIEVYDAARQRSVFAYNADRLFVPASNTKLVVTAVAMGLLGPDYRYRTPLVATGAPGDTTVATLVVKGSGDPTWSARFHGSDTFVLEQLADSLRAAGVRSVGTLVGDLSSMPPWSVHWTWLTGDLVEAYAAPTSAIAVAEAAARVIITGGNTIGDTAAVRLIGSPGAFNVSSAVLTDTARASTAVYLDYELWPSTVRMAGRVALNRMDTVSMAAPEPARYALAALRDVLQARGIRVDAITLTHDSSVAATHGAQRTITTWTSPPLTEIVTAILHPSQNWIAEQLLRTLGRERGRSASWSDAIQVERRYLIDVARIDSTEFHLADGSGLSTQNLFTPRAFVRLLEHTRASPWADAYRDALPAAAMPRTTLSNRFQGLEGRLFAKTGSLTHVTGLSGFVHTATGDDLTFSILVNGSGVAQADARRAIDAFVRALATRETTAR